MGSFKGHIIPGSLFLIVGVWHIWNSMLRYVKNPRSFKVRVWNPVPGFGGKLKYVEIYVIVVGSFFDMCVEFLYATKLRIFENGILSPSHMNNFEHGGMLVMFFIFGVALLLSEKTSLLPLTDGALCIIAAAAFCVEYLLFYFHSTNHAGLEGYYHFILVSLILLCILSSVAGAVFPSSFAVDLTSAISVTLQGLWFYQTAFTLYGPMMPSGCSLKSDNVVCLNSEDEIRGELLANSQVFFLVLGVIVLSVVFYKIAMAKFGNQNQTNESEIAETLDMN